VVEAAVRVQLFKSALLVTCGVLLSATVSAQTAGSQKPGAQAKDPYGKLFEPEKLEAMADRALAQTDALARNIARPTCTIRIIPADPMIDPKIRVEPDTRDTRYTIRAVPPPACK
jgi:hypothetical protein